MSTTDDQIAHFTSISGTTPEQARFYLDAAGGDIETALSTFFESGGQNASTNANDDDALMNDDLDDLNQGDEELARATQAEFQAALASAANAGRGSDNPVIGNTIGGGGPSLQSAEATRAAVGGNGGAGGAGGGGGQTLGGGAAEPLPAGWGSSTGASSSSSSRSATPSNPFRSNAGPRVTGFRDLASSASAGPSAPPARGSGPRLGRVAHHDEDDGDEDDKDDKDPSSFFAGGEKSGLAVQNPNHGSGSGPESMIKDILRRAQEAGSKLAGLAGSAVGGPTQSANVFTGGAHTLGSDETPSTFIPDPTRGENDEDEDGAEDEEDEEVARRNLYFWSDGFSVDDGDLLRYDDPQNAQILAAINAGRAPLSLLKVRHDQPVELIVSKRLEEKYSRQAGAPLGPWGGEGNRLGDATPLFNINTTTTTSTAPTTRTSAPTAATGTFSPETQFEVDANAPTTNLQIRLRDGTRMVARFNHSHTVGDIRGYINAANPGHATTSYALQTTFPSRDLTDDKQTIKDAGLLGSVVVQRGL